MGPLTCPLEYGHHHSLTVEVNDLRDQRNTLVNRLKGAQSAVEVLTGQVNTLTAKVQENATLAEAAVFVGKSVLVYSGAATVPHLLGVVQSMIVGWRPSGKQVVTLMVAPRVGTAQLGEALRVPFDLNRFEEIG